ncbi:MAG TPA: immunoglobulin-like domain-containing protein, partial [Casimicrobiaceae bacterium]|nr:immunoglobulin-like domain-containing protein [Casimicrobiaceae bacterium]
MLTIAGENPAHIRVGDTYADLGATITGPQADLNLGIKTFLNGTLVSDIVLDTSTTTTGTIDYVVTDQNGLTSTSTRTVFIEPVAPSTPQS